LRGHEDSRTYRLLDEYLAVSAIKLNLSRGIIEERCRLSSQDISLRRLKRRVADKKLHLLKVAAAFMAELCASLP